MPAVLLLLLLAGCMAPAEHYVRADRVAGEIIAAKQQEALGRREPFTVESAGDTLRRRLLLDQRLPVSHPASLGASGLPAIDHWPEQPPAGETTPSAPGGLDRLRSLSLRDALQIAAAGSREYQAAKEEVFQAALDLDLERNTFRNIFTGTGSSEISTDRGSDPAVSGVENSVEAQVSRTLESGLELTALLALDLVKLLTADRATSLGITADTSVSIPLWRGAGRHIAAEPLRLAERAVVYRLWEFERYKRTFAVNIAGRYLGVLQQADRVANTQDNYQRLIAASRRARRLADAGRLPEIQVDQAAQDELRARERWISSTLAYQRELDGFKTLLGLPPDADIRLDASELERLAADSRDAPASATGPAPDTGPDTEPSLELPEPQAADAGPYEIEPGRAVDIALANRLDLRTARERLYDAQRAVVVAADALRGELTLLGGASLGQSRSLGSADLPDADLRPGEGYYSALLTLDPPLERTKERHAYRSSYLELARRTRDLQEQEDRVKQEVRNRLRDLREAREGLRIQKQAVRVAERRVASTNLFLQAGRAVIRDLLEAQEARVLARNALTSALVQYRIAELELQRDMGVLKVDEQGVWKEYQPENDEDHEQP